MPLKRPIFHALMPDMYIVRSMKKGSHPIRSQQGIYAMASDLSSWLTVQPLLRDSMLVGFDSLQSKG